MRRLRFTESARLERKGEDFGDKFAELLDDLVQNHEPTPANMISLTIGFLKSARYYFSTSIGYRRRERG